MESVEAREARIMRELREDRFKDHRAELIECGEVTILKWKAPGTWNNYIRYVFDGKNLYISGDMGEAVFKFTDYVKECSFENMWVNYFFGKMCTCSNDKFVFDNDVAEKELLEWKEEYCEFIEDCQGKEQFIETIDSIIKDLGYHYSDIETMIYEDEEYKEFLEEHCAFEGGWIYGVGQVIPYLNYAFLVGLRMASEQLK